MLVHLIITGRYERAFCTKTHAAHAFDLAISDSTTGDFFRKRIFNRIALAGKAPSSHAYSDLLPELLLSDAFLFCNLFKLFRRHGESISQDVRVAIVCPLSLRLPGRTQPRALVRMIPSSGQ